MTQLTKIKTRQCGIFRHHVRSERPPELLTAAHAAIVATRDTKDRTIDSGGAGFFLPPRLQRIANPFTDSDADFAVIYTSPADGLRCRSGLRHPPVDHALEDHVTGLIVNVVISVGFNDGYLSSWPLPPLMGKRP